MDTRRRRQGTARHVPRRLDRTSLGNAVRAPVVVVLHHLERPFTGHAGRVLRAAGVTLDERDLSGEGFRSGPCAWGIQFHPEVDAHALED